jgi:ribulose-phosphate 3-epimerase
MKRIIPTVFATNKKDFDIRLSRLLKVSGNIQIDVMDGRFVKVKSISLKEISGLKKHKKKFEAHLMVEEPEKMLDELKNKGFKKIIFHFESFDDIEKARRLVFLIKDKKMEPWIAFNPNTKFGNIINVIENIHALKGILLMGHSPGLEHLQLDQNVVRRVENIRKLNKKIKIQIDGGINAENIRKLAKLGVNYFNVGSFVAESKNPEEALKELHAQL